MPHIVLAKTKGAVVAGMEPACGKVNTPSM